MKTFKLFLVFLLLMPILSISQNINNDSLINLSLEELMNIEIKIATKSGTNIRETPGVVSTISNNEIALSGARDLMEILQIFTPGIGFGVDVEGVVGIGIRGLWAHEGKVLLMINGMSINDEQFATTQFGNHINADIIDHIEIIRGPGSSIYGGYAELGVINVITKNTLNNTYVSGTYSTMENSISHKNIAAGGGYKNNDLEISFNTAYNKGNRSENNIVDYSGVLSDMTNMNKLNSMFINFDVKYKNLKASYMLDKYETSTMDLWGSNTTPYNENWDTHNTFVSYDINIDKLKITPYVKYKYQLPWHTTMLAEEYINSKNATKSTGGFIGTYSINDKTEILIGSEYYDHRLNWPKDISSFEDTSRTNKDYISITNFAAFAQATLKTQWLNIMVGGRLDATNQFGNSFVPRIAATKVFDKLHFKAMISGSFRTPGGIIPNRTLTISDKMKPEKGMSYEIESGYKVTQNSWLTVNAFMHQLTDVIAYQTNGAVGYYSNSGKLGSAGIEATYRFITDFFNMNINYSYYQPIKFSKKNSYICPTNDNYYLGFSKHRLNVFAGLKINEFSQVSLTGRYYGKKYGIIASTGKPVTQSSDPQVILDITYNIKSFLFDKLNASIGVHNITDENLHYYQGYDGDHAGLPSLSRALVMKLNYQF